MATAAYKRKLTAILSADVAGYSRLMGKDEEATVRTLTGHREAMAQTIQQFRGRVVDSPGDNVLAEFGSVVDAVRCALQIQHVLKERNAKLTEDRRMAFRIGLNLGDVIQDGDRIYGDGVNIAARLEGLAEPGGICISGTVYEHVRNKLTLWKEYLGAHEVKNIVEPIEVYRVDISADPAPSRSKQPRVFLKGLHKRTILPILIALILMAAGFLAWRMDWTLTPPGHDTETDEAAAPFPSKRSIAVLPFINMSDDAAQDYFADGITEDLITDLSKISDLFVIARSSSFTYKGKPVKIQQVGKELGVRFVLEGSVRKAGNDLRINAQLIDAASGHHLWADRYDGQFKDIFSLQDQIIRKIIAALAVRLTAGEARQVTRARTQNIEAYDAFLQGKEYVLRLTPEDLARGIPYFEKAIRLDPQYWQAYAALAQTYTDGSWMGLLQTLGISWIEARIKGLEYLKIAMKNPPSLAYQVISSLLLFKRQHENALLAAEKAIAADPNDPGGHLVMSDVLMMMGRPAEALGFLEKARRLDPHMPGVYLFAEGMARFCLGQLPETVSLIERALSYNPQVRPMAAPLIAAYAHLGKDKEARDLMRELIENWPFSPIPVDLKVLMYGFPLKHPEPTLRLATGLRRAGMPGEEGGYLKLYDTYRLTGDEIRDLLFGKTVWGRDPFSGEEFQVSRTLEGKATLESFLGADSGKSWIEGNILFDQWDHFMDGIELSGNVYRNPDGTWQQRNAYIRLDDLGFVAFSPMDRGKD